MIGSLQNAAHFSQIGFYSVEILEVGLRACSDDLGQGGLTGSGWPEEDEGLDAVGINGAAEQETRGQKMPLACVLRRSAGQPRVARARCTTPKKRSRRSAKLSVVSK